MVQYDSVATAITLDTNSVFTSLIDTCFILLGLKKGISMYNKKEALIVILAILTLTSVVIIPAFSADTLTPSDFTQESFYKIIDFFDYTRSNAAAAGKTPPANNTHAWLYLTYVNKSGIQMMYGGLQNITDETYSITAPIQTWMMHYKSRNQTEDIVTAGAFIMLLAFNDTTSSIYENSPDKNDTLYGSLNLGFDLTAHFGSETPPGLATKTSIIPLTSSNNGLNWHWGMTYTNMTAIWWETSMNTPVKIFRAITRYDELTFTYDLVLNPTDGTAILTANYVIGKITDLWLFPVFWHYNNTGGYGPFGIFKLDALNVHQILTKWHIKMSIVQFQSTVVLGHTTTSESNGENAKDSEEFVGNSSITTKINLGERIFDANFATKQTYRLYNYTEDHTETEYTTYNTTTRTAKSATLANNPIFLLHTSLMKYIPIVLANMDPALYQQAKEHLLSLTYADYFYIIAYPTYGGYRIEHDPTYTAYYNAAAGETTKPPSWTGLILVVAIIAIIIIVAVVALRSRRPKTPGQQTNPPQSSGPPSPTFFVLCWKSFVEQFRTLGL